MGDGTGLNQKSEKRGNKRLKQSNPVDTFLSKVNSQDDVVTEDDTRALAELENKFLVSDMKNFILERRRNEARRQELIAAEKKAPHPFAVVDTNDLLLLTNHWHGTVAQGATEELARRQLITFTQHTYTGYVASWHHIEYAKKLDAFIRKEIKNLMVFMPPQHGKSELCSRRMPAKLLGDRPDSRVAIVSYNHTFASKFNRDVQRIIDSEEYQTLFPGTMLNAQNIRTVAGTYVRNADEFEIVGKRGSLVSVGVGGGLTGRPVDVLIIDDPYKDQKAAWSPVTRSSIQDWYDAVAQTRLHNESQQLITLTRWHEDDLAGRILKAERDKWEVVIFPAIKEGPPIEYDPREPGQALWPEVHSLERMEAAKKRNLYVFNAMYQQNPKPAEGLLFPPDSLNYFAAEDIVNMDFDTILAVSDVADRGSDYYCMPIVGVKGERIYFLDVIYTQEPVKVTIPLTLAKLKEWRPVRHRIESNAGGSIFAHSIREQKETATLLRKRPPAPIRKRESLWPPGRFRNFAGSAPIMCMVPSMRPLCGH